MCGWILIGLMLAMVWPDAFAFLVIFGLVFFVAQQAAIFGKWGNR